VEDGSEFVYGIDGTLCDSAGKEKGDVEGVVRPISEKKWKHTDDAGVDRDEVVSHAWFQLQDGSLARFEEGKYVRVSAADSNSIVCIGTRHTEAEETDFAGQVAMSDIRRITTEEADVVGTVALITLGAAAVGLVIVFANIDMGTIKVASYN
jgi:hypothetical protein